MAGYSNLTLLDVSNNQLANPLPQDLCSLNGPLYIQNTSITSIPECFQCDLFYWKSQGVEFKPNSLMSLDTTKKHQCLSFSLVESPKVLVGTRGGDMVLQGTSLGWDLDGGLRSTVIVPNSKIVYRIGSGVGYGLSLQLRFHRLDIGMDKLFYYAYKPPVIFEIVYQNNSNSLTIKGENFGNLPNQLVLVIGGVVVGSESIKTLDHEIIELHNNPIPYSSDLLVSFTVEVANQKISHYINTLTGTPILYGPYKELSKQGGIAVVYGDYLTYDISLIELKLGGVNCQVLSSNKTMIQFKYPKIPILGRLLYPLSLKVANYTYENGTMMQYMKCEIGAGGLTRSYCNEDGLLVCKGNWTGNECTSLPLDDLFYTSKLHSLGHSPNIFNYLYQFTLESVIEVTSTGGFVRKWNLNDLELWVSSGLDSYSMTLGDVDSHQLVTVRMQSVGNSLIKLTVVIDKYQFKEQNNTMKLVFSSNLNQDFLPESNMDMYCSLNELGNDPTRVDCDYQRTQYLDKSIYTRIPRLISIDNTWKYVNNSIGIIYPEHSDLSVSYKATTSIHIPYFQQSLTIPLEINLLKETMDISSNPLSKCYEKPLKLHPKLHKKRFLSWPIITGITVSCIVVSFTALLIASLKLYKKWKTTKFEKEQKKFEKELELQRSQNEGKDLKIIKH